MPTLTINLPSGVTDGCAMVAVIAFQGNDTISFVAATITNPAGWASVVADPSASDSINNTSGIQLHMAIRIASATEPSSYTWTSDAPNNTGNLLPTGYILVYE